MVIAEELGVTTRLATAVRSVCAPVLLGGFLVVRADPLR